MIAALAEKVLLTEMFQGAVWRSSFHCDACGGECALSAAYCAACGRRFTPGYTERRVIR